MNKTLFSEIENDTVSNNTDLVWKHSNGTAQSKAQKDFAATLRKHQLMIEREKQIDDLLSEATHIYSNDIMAEEIKQNDIERERFIFMLDIYITDKLNLKGKIKELYRLMLLDICDENSEDHVNEIIYRNAIIKLETPAEKKEREYHIKMAEKQMKDQFGIDIDMEEMANADMNDEATKERLKEKYKDFFEKQQGEFENKTNADFDFKNAFGFKNKAQKKTAKQLEKEKQVKEVEDLLNKDINKLFKELAKVIHPDREQDPELRDKKEILMKQLSNARDNMNIGEIIYIKLLIDELVPESAVDTIFNDDSLKRFAKIIKQKISEIEAVNFRKLYQHPLFCELEFSFVKKIIANSNKSNLRSLLEKNILAIQNETNILVSQFENIKQKPKLIKDLVRKYEKDNFNDEDIDEDDFFEFFKSVKFR